MPSLHQITVNLGPRSYGVVVGTSLLCELGSRTRTALGASARRALVVVDSALQPRAHDVIASLVRAGFTPAISLVAPSEPTKSLATLERVLADAAAHGLERAEPIIAVGGGVVGDIAGFAGATYRRGVPVIQVPTTLLAMVDAAVGGKTGVNLSVPNPGPRPELRKNFVGAFHQPRLVLADVFVLSTLPPRQFSAGLAECVKHAMLGAVFADAGLMDWFEGVLPPIHAQEPPVVGELIARNVAIKARVVERDEFEEAASADAGRALLNLGHTFAHAIETLPGLSVGGAVGPLLHGEAVALGLSAACAAAVQVGLIDAGYADRVRTLLTRCGLTLSIAGLPPNAEVQRLMGADKKTRGGQMRLVLPCGPGQARVVGAPPASAVAAGLDAIRAAASA